MEGVGQQRVWLDDDGDFLRRLHGYPLERHDHTPIVASPHGHVCPWRSAQVTTVDGQAGAVDITGLRTGQIRNERSHFHRLAKAGTLKRTPLLKLVAATSVGIVEGVTLLDLAYEEDSQAEVDMNVVMTEDGGLVEIQATAERQTFAREKLLEMMDHAQAGISELVEAQRSTLAAALHELK